jgi:DNA-binding GntR family transcriptional regulator
VRRLQPDDVLRIYEMRRLLEPWAAGEAAASDFDPTAARQALDEAERFVATDDRVALTLANRRFHRCLYASCPNPLVVATLDSLQDLTALGTTSLLWEQWPTWRDEMAEHRVILDAVQEGDAKAAERLVRRHIEQSITRLRTILPHLDEPVAR